MFDLKFVMAGYITTSISDGPGCLMLRCPDPSCDAVVGQDMINGLATTDDKEKYARYLHRSYIEDNRKVKPSTNCPATSGATQYIVLVTFCHRALICQIIRLSKILRFT